MYCLVAEEEIGRSTYRWKLQCPAMIGVLPSESFQGLKNVSADARRVSATHEITHGSAKHWGSGDTICCHSRYQPHQRTEEHFRGCLNE